MAWRSLKLSEQRKYETLLAAAEAERDRYQLLLDINNAVVTHLDLGNLLRATSDSLRKVIAHDAAAIGLYDPDTGQLRFHTFDLQYKGRAEEGALLSARTSSVPCTTRTGS
jgi:hypothetical protein